MVYPFETYLAENDDELKLFINSVYQDKGLDCLSSLPNHISLIIKDKDTFVIKKGAFSTAPVYYSCSPAYFHCDFTIKNVLAKLPFLPKPSSEKIARYFDFNNELSDSNNLTFYEDVWRLLPGETLVYEAGKFSFFLSDSIDLHKEVPTYEQHIDDIRKHFTDSVNKRIIGRKKVAANLSGGLDSSAITSVAQSLRSDTLVSLYKETHTEETDEFHFAEKVSEKHQTDLQKVSPEKNYLMAAVRRVTERTGLPETSNIFSALNLVVLDACLDNGVDTLLSGVLGDQVIDYGYDYFDELAGKRQWSMLNQVMSEHQYSGTLRESETVRFALKELRKKPNFLNAWSIYKELCVDGNIGKRRFFWLTRKFLSAKIMEYVFPDPINKLKAQLVRNGRKGVVKMHNPVKLVTGEVSQTAKRTTKWIFQHVAVEAIEQFYLLYNAVNISVRYPFFDKELIQTTLLSKNEWKLRNGISRSTLREALQDYLPQEVYQRRSKAVFTTYLIETYREFYKAFKSEYGNEYYSHPIWDICNRKVFEKLSDLVLNDAVKSFEKIRVVFLMYRVLYLAIWLDYLKTQND
jgi:asparagine synthase (glutamine-hydrolysing)